MRGETERQAEMLLRRLQELGEWQETTEKRLIAEQKQELLRSFPQAVGAENDTEDDTTVSSMEFDNENEQEARRLSFDWQDQADKLNVSSATEQYNNETQIQKSSSNQSFNTEQRIRNEIRYANSIEEQYFDQKSNFHHTPTETKLENVEPKPFLRRGAGLARFNLPTDPNQQPNRVKCKQPRITNVKSKYNQETEAFRSKKTNPWKSPVSTPQNITKSPEGPRPRSVSKTVKHSRPFKSLPMKEPEPSLKLIWNRTKGAKVKNSPRITPPEPVRQSSICDSVEHSFREKLSIQERRQAKELKELEVFEILEDATLDSSFNSTSSRFNTLVHNSILPSPTKEKAYIDQGTYTRNSSRQNKVESTNPSLGDTLLVDIEKFLKDAEDKSNEVKVVDDIFPDKNAGEDSETSTIINDEVSYKEEKYGLGVLALQEINEDNTPGYNSTLYIHEDEIGSSKQHKNGNDEDTSYQASVLKLRIAELENEIDTFKKETSNIKNLQMKLEKERAAFHQRTEQFVKEKEKEETKVEKCVQRLKQEKVLLEKLRKEAERKNKTCQECEANRAKVTSLTDEMKEKDAKWNILINSLHEKLVKASKEKLDLQNENYRFRIKNAKSKIGQELRTNKVDQCQSVLIVNHQNGEDLQKSITNKDQPVSREFLYEDEVSSDSVHKANITSSLLRKQVETVDESTTNFAFSSATSLESSMTLVSGAVDLTEVMLNRESGTREKRFEDGRVEFWYSNGNRKEISADGETVRVFYYNGDMKESHSSGLVKYLYSNSHTWHTTNRDGSEVTEFSNGQREERGIDGTVTISFPDGSTKTISTNGVENITFPDGTTVKTHPNGDRTVNLPNGQIEEHTEEYKKRTYPDGTVKTVFADGRQHTRHSSGRVRLRDGKGNILQDQMELVS